MRRLVLVAGAVLGAGAAIAFLPAPASAHPLGNFSVNQYAAMSLYPDRIEVAATVDTAELPTAQEQATVDGDGDGTASAAERSAYAETSCAAFAGDFTVSVAGDALEWRVVGRTFEYGEGAAGLPVSRLDCSLVADAPLGAATTVGVANRYRDDRVGWRELTATGHGVRLVDSPLPARSVSDELRAYPEDLLSAPLDVRSAELRVEPGGGTGTVADVDEPAVPSAPATTRWLAGAERALDGLVGDRLTPMVGVLAVLLALVLGAAHAALPGHGKTVMAAYLAGRQGRARDAVAVGATVTLTHTGGVLVVGLLLTTVASLAGETVLGWLGVASGGLVVAVGAGMLLGAVRRRRIGHHHHHHGHGHHHHHDHEHDDHDHGHGHGDGDGDGHGHGHHHHHPHGRPSRLSILGIGIAGGLVPSPSALIVLLGAIGLGRTAFGVLLVVAYGAGMAATLTAAGLVLIRLRDKWVARRRGAAPRWPQLAKRLTAAAPTATASMVLLVGLGLAGRAVSTLA
jgi:nickel/cobalt transporter (NicO) family protein